MSEQYLPVKPGSCVPLAEDCKPGDYVHWRKIGDPDVSTGFLKEWDNGTAIIVQSDGKEHAVRVR